MRTKSESPFHKDALGNPGRRVKEKEVESNAYSSLLWFGIWKSGDLYGEGSFVWQMDGRAGACAHYGGCPGRPVGAVSNAVLENGGKVIGVLPAVESIQKRRHRD